MRIELLPNVVPVKLSTGTDLGQRIQAVQEATFHSQTIEDSEIFTDQRIVFFELPNKESAASFGSSYRAPWKLRRYYA